MRPDFAGKPRGAWCNLKVRTPMGSGPSARGVRVCARTEPHPGPLGEAHSIRDAGGIAACSRWSSEAIPPDKTMGLIHPGRGGSHAPWQRRWHPFRMPGNLGAFYRWYRSAQPPATSFHPCRDAAKQVQSGLDRKFRLPRVSPCRLMSPRLSAGNNALVLLDSHASQEFGGNNAL